jgi:hypothetical protein
MILQVWRNDPLIVIRLFCGLSIINLFLYLVTFYPASLVCY